VKTGLNELGHVMLVLVTNILVTQTKVETDAQVQVEAVKARAEMAGAWVRRSHRPLT
jgi:hypothetical protein